MNSVTYLCTVCILHNKYQFALFIPFPSKGFLTHVHIYCSLNSRMIKQVFFSGKLEPHSSCHIHVHIIVFETFPDNVSHVIHEINVLAVVAHQLLPFGLIMHALLIHNYEQQ